MKKILFVLLVLCLRVPSHALSTWDGVSASTEWYTQGSGAVYHIKTAEDLAGLSKCFSQGYYLYGDFEGRTIYLDDDIDLNGHEWTPIGTIDAQSYYYAFAGTFDGQGHTIKGLKITKTNANPYIKVAGLFGYAPNDSFSVSNLKVEGTITLTNPCDANSYTSLYIGGIVGSGESTGNFEKCQSNVNIDITQNIGEWIKVYCGGIVGNVNSSNTNNLFSGCYSNGNIQVALNNANSVSVGGIAGQVTSPESRIEQCASEVNMILESGKSTDAGGIIGLFGGKSLRNALFSGNIVLSYPSYGLCGGISGMNVGTTTFENCLMTGSISKNYGTGWLSAISGTSSESISVVNCYYLSGLPNSTSYGMPMSEAELKSGIPIDGFDTDIWVFPTGAYPYLGFTKPTYILNLALEGGYVGMRLNEGVAQKFILTQASDTELYQVLWNGEDITDLVDSNGNITTPEIYDNTVLSVIYRSSGVNENTIAEKITTFKIQGSSVSITNPQGIQDLKIYNKAGVLIQKAMNVGCNITIEDLMHDVYIINVNNEAFKIII